MLLEGRCSWRGGAPGEVVVFHPVQIGVFLENLVFHPINLYLVCCGNLYSLEP